METFLRVSAALVAIAAALGAMQVIWKRVRGFFRFVREAGDGIAYVKAQMENNGGSSLRDAIDRTEAKVTTLEGRFDTLDDRVELLERIHERQDLVDQIVAENAAKLKTARPHLPPREAS